MNADAGTDLLSITGEATWLAAATAVLGGIATYYLFPLMSVRAAVGDRAPGHTTRLLLGLPIGVLGLVGVLLGQFVLWRLVLPPGGWVWIPPVMVTALILSLQVDVVRRRQRSAARQLEQRRWRALRDDRIELRRWFVVRAPLRTALIAWSWFPVAHLSALYFWAVLRLPFVPVADRVSWNAQSLVVMATAVGLAVVALLGGPRMLPTALMTSRVFGGLPRRWSLVAGWGRTASRTPALVDIALRRRGRRLPTTQRARFAEAARVLVEILGLTERAGYTALRPRLLHRDTERVALRLAVGENTQTALDIYDSYVERWALTGFEPTGSSGWTLARVVQGVGAVRDVVAGAAAVLAIGVTIALVIAGGSLADLTDLR